VVAKKAREKEGGEENENASGEYNGWMKKEKIHDQSGRTDSNRTEVKKGKRQ